MSKEVTDALERVKTILGDWASSEDPAQNKKVVNILKYVEIWNSNKTTRNVELADLKKKIKGIEKSISEFKSDSAVYEAMNTRLTILKGKALDIDPDCLTPKVKTPKKKNIEENVKSVPEAETASSVDAVPKKETKAVASSTREINV